LSSGCALQGERHARTSHRLRRTGRSRGTPSCINARGSTCVSSVFVNIAHFLARTQQRAYLETRGASGGSYRDPRHGRVARCESFPRARGQTRTARPGSRPRERGRRANSVDAHQAMVAAPLHRQPDRGPYVRPHHGKGATSSQPRAVEGKTPPNGQLARAVAICGVFAAAPGTVK
jgi:hypothetical protein